MTNDISVPVQPTVQTASHLPMFGPPPLLAGEDSAVYDRLLADVSVNLKPSDIFEEIWVREIVDLIWEGLRWRRLINEIITAALPSAIERIVQPLLQNQPARNRSFMAQMDAISTTLDGPRRLAAAWTANDPAAIERVNDLLASAGMTMQTVVAQAAAREMDKIERFNRLVANAEARRDALLHEIERHRFVFAQKLREQVHKIDADVPVITSDPAPPQSSVQ